MNKHSAELATTNPLRLPQRPQKRPSDHGLLTAKIGNHTARTASPNPTTPSTKRTAGRRCTKPSAENAYAANMQSRHAMTMQETTGRASPAAAIATKPCGAPAKEYQAGPPSGMAKCSNAPAMQSSPEANNQYLEIRDNPTSKT